MLYIFLYYIYTLILTSDHFFKAQNVLKEFEINMTQFKNPQNCQRLKNCHTGMATGVAFCHQKTHYKLRLLGSQLFLLKLDSEKHCNFSRLF